MFYVRCGNPFLARFNTFFDAMSICKGKSIGREDMYIRFSLDPVMRLISSAGLRDLFRHPTAIVPMKLTNAFLLVCSKKMLKRDGDKM